MNFFSITVITLGLLFANLARAENCDIHVPLKDADLSKYQSTINGYHLIPQSNPNAPFNLLLNDVTKFEGKNIYTIELTHASGFKKEYHFTMTEKDWNGHTLKDLANLVIEKKMAEAKTIAEFEAQKAKLNPAKNKVIPPMTELEFLLKELPSCDKMFKKETK